MGLLELIPIAIGLSMDAFAVSICKGLALSQPRLRDAFLVGVWFGGFQALMPFLGFLLASRFQRFIAAFAPYLSFLLLLLIGVHMIRDARAPSDPCADHRLDPRTMLLLSLATSIDALAVGVTFAALPVHILPAPALSNALLAAAIIGVTTFTLSTLGARLGARLSSRLQTKATLVGGVILILIGVKVLIEGLL